MAKTGDKHLLDLVRNQWEFDRIVSPYLYAGIEYDAMQEPARWWPLGPEKDVVIDPLRSFGAPIVHKGGVPTATLARAYQAEGSMDMVAGWFELDVLAVRHAVEFETRSVS